MSTSTEHPKIFISDSWTSPEHEQFVVDLATTLRGHGIDAVLDKGVLKPGHDKYVFMESMVVDPGVQKSACAMRPEIPGEGYQRSKRSISNYRDHRTLQSWAPSDARTTSKPRPLQRGPKPPRSVLGQMISQAILTATAAPTTCIGCLRPPNL